MSRGGRAATKNFTDEEECVETKGGNEERRERKGKKGKRREKKRNRERERHGFVEIERR